MCQDISDVDKEQLVLYAQMANLVKLLLPSLEIDLKEITHNFSKVNFKLMLLACCTVVCVFPFLFKLICVIVHQTRDSLSFIFSYI